MFRYKGNEVTLENFKGLFANLPMDMLDEIRLAILDSTEIGNAVDSVKSDSYKLGQIRISIREGVPDRFRNVVMSGELIKKLRECYLSKVDMTPLCMYISPMGTLTVSDKTMVQLADCITQGVSISDINFNQVSEELVEDLCFGLKNGFPMWLCINTKLSLTKQKLKLLIQGMQLGLDITVLLGGDWSESCIKVLIASGVDTFYQVTYNTTPAFTVGRLLEIINAIKSGVDISEITKTIGNEPRYNKDQIHEIVEVLKLGLPIDSLITGNKSAIDMSKERLRLRNTYKK